MRTDDIPSQPADPPDPRRTMKLLVLAGSLLVVAGIVASFIAQMLMGFCPVP
jgi:hypothetical protein